MRGPTPPDAAPFLAIGPSQPMTPGHPHAPRPATAMRPLDRDAKRVSA